MIQESPFNTTRMDIMRTIERMIVRVSPRNRKSAFNCILPHTIKKEKRERSRELNRVEMLPRSDSLARMGATSGEIDSGGSSL